VRMRRHLCALTGLAGAMWLAGALLLGGAILPGGAMLPGLAVPAAAAEAPRRIVSFNLCADQLVLALADPGQIAGLSPFAADPAMSVMAQEAKAFPTADARSEAAVALGPDLVLTGPFDRSSVRAVLTRLGLRVVEVGLVADISGAVAQVREVAGLLGHPERGEALAARIEAAAAQLSGEAASTTRTALIVERRGYVTGPDTLAGALLRLAGLKAPPGAPQGLGGFLSLERLLVINPDLLAVYGAVTEPGDQGAVYLTHPALRGRFPPQRRLDLSPRFALCGGAALLASIGELRKALAATRR